MAYAFPQHMKATHERCWVTTEVAANEETNAARLTIVFHGRTGDLVPWFQRCTRTLHEGYSTRPWMQIYVRCKRQNRSALIYVLSHQREENHARCKLLI